MTSFDPNYEGVIQYCESCGRKMSSFEIGTDRLTAEDHPDRGLCSDCRPGIDKKMEAAEKRLELLGPVTSEEIDKEIRNLLNEESELPGGYCPDCCENPCVCKEEHPNSHYSDPPGEHEYHDHFDYSGHDFRSERRLFPFEEVQRELFPEFAKAI